MKRALTSILFGTLLTTAIAQTFSLQQAMDQALQYSPYLKVTELDIERHETLKRAAPDIPKTDFQLLYGQYNSIEKHDNNITITQTLPFPTTVARQVQHAKARLTAAEYRYEMTRQELLYEVKRTFFELLYLKERKKLLLHQDSLLLALSNTAALRYKTGEATLLEKTAAETQRSEARNQVQRVQSDYQIVVSRLAALLNCPADGTDGELFELPPLALDTGLLQRNPALKFSRQQIRIAESGYKLQRSTMMPDIRFGYFNQTLIGPQNVNGVETTFGPDRRFQGFQVGLTIPIWFFNWTASSEAAKLSNQMALHDAAQTQLQLSGRWLQAVGEMDKARNNLIYYKDQALPNVELLTRQNFRSYETGEITYTTFLLNAQNALRIQEAHLAAVNEWNQSIINYEFITGSIHEK